MSDQDEMAGQFRARYRAGEAPWDTGVPSPELVRVLEAGLLPGPTVLEMGCGTGTNAIELARRGYRVTAVDLVDVAIEKARAKAREAGVSIDFREGDLTRLDLGGPYDALFDLGLYHGLRLRNLDGLLRTLDRVSRPGTRWLCIAGNAKEPSAVGPPVVSELEFRTELGPRFRFLEVREIRLRSHLASSPLAWSILMERSAERKP